MSLVENVMSVEARERTVTFYRVTIGEDVFDGEDLHNTCEAIIEGDIAVTNAKMVKVLKKIGVLKHGGSRRMGIAASAGPNIREFTQGLEAKLKAAGWRE